MKTFFLGILFSCIALGFIMFISNIGLSDPTAITASQYNRNIETHFSSLDKEVTANKVIYRIGTNKVSGIFKEDNVVEEIRKRIIGGENVIGLPEVSSKNYVDSIIAVAHNMTYENKYLMRFQTISSPIYFANMCFCSPGKKKIASYGEDNKGFFTKGSSVGYRTVILTVADLVHQMSTLENGVQAVFTKGDSTSIQQLIHHFTEGNKCFFVS